MFGKCAGLALLFVVYWNLVSAKATGQNQSSTGNVQTQSLQKKKMARTTGELSLEVTSLVTSTM